MTTFDLDALLATAERAARAGGEIVRTQFGRARDVRAKAPGDWVSETDFASETATREILEREMLNLAVLGPFEDADHFKGLLLPEPVAV